MTNGSSVETNGRLALFAVLGAALLFSTGGLAIKSMDVSPWAIAAGRSLVAALFLLAVRPAARQFSRGTFLVAIAYGATLALYVLANRATTATNAIALQSTAPLHMLIVGPLFFGEFVRRRDIAPTAIVAVGTTLILIAPEPASPFASDPTLGNGYALASGFTWALTLGGLRRLSQKGESALGATVLGNLLVAACFGPALLEYTSASSQDLACIAFLGVVQIGIAYLLLTYGLSRMRAWTASIVLLLEPVTNPIWVGLAHGEWPSFGAIVGGALLLAGATAVVARKPSVAKAKDTWTEETKLDE